MLARCARAKMKVKICMCSFHRLVLGKPIVDVFDTILPCFSDILELEERAVWAKRPSLKVGAIQRCSKQVKSVLDLQDLIAKKVHAVLNANGASWGDSFVLLELVANTYGCTHITLIIQSKRKETKKERNQTDIQLFADYEKAVWKFRSEYRGAKIFPVFICLNDASSVFEGDEGE